MKSVKRSVLAVVLAGLAAAPAPAPTPTPVGPKDQWKYTPPSAPSGPTSGELLGRLALLTSIVAGIGLACVWAARRRYGFAPQTGDAPMKVLERLSLGPRCTLHLLQVEESTFLVGTDVTGVRSIQPLSGPFDEVLEAAPGQTSDSPPARTHGIDAPGPPREDHTQ